MFLKLIIKCYNNSNIRIGVSFQRDWPHRYTLGGLIRIEIVFICWRWVSRLTHYIRRWLNHYNHWDYADSTIMSILTRLGQRNFHLLRCRQRKFISTSIREYTTNTNNGRRMTSHCHGFAIGATRLPFTYSVESNKCVYAFPEYLH